MDSSAIDPQLLQSLMALQDPDEDPAMQKATRQQKMVDALRGSTIHNMQGKMVGNRYVNPSMTAQLLNGLTLAMGAGKERQLDNQMVGLSEKRTDARTKYTDRLVKALRARGGNDNTLPVIPASPRPDLPPDDDFMTDPAAGY